MSMNQEGKGKRHGSCQNMELKGEDAMMPLAQILLGLVMGLLGFHAIASEPAGGCSALLVAGLFILTGLERLMRGRPRVGDTGEAG